MKPYPWPSSRSASLIAACSSDGPVQVCVDRAEAAEVEDEALLDAAMELLMTLQEAEERDRMEIEEAAEMARLEEEERRRAEAEEAEAERKRCALDHLNSHASVPSICLLPAACCLLPAACCHPPVCLP